MECPNCRAPYQPGDRFCGSCGERLPAAGGAPAGGPAPGPGAAAPGRSSRAATIATSSPLREPAGDGLASSGGGPTIPCPTCGAALTPGQPKCSVCGMEFSFAGGPASDEPASGSPFGRGNRPSAGAFDQTIAIPGPVPAGRDAPALGGGRAGADGGVGATMENPLNRGDAPPLAPPPALGAPPAGRAESRGGALLCPIHGQMDPTWTRCPQCLKEGREGRLMTPSGGVPLPPADIAARAPRVEESARPQPPSAGFPPAQASPAAAGMPPVAQAPIGPPPQPAPPTFTGSGNRVPAQPMEVERPASSVGRTVVVRRGPRILAYLIEKEGSQVGRAFQLEDDITDIGRDPRNHLVVNDPMVSAFHARVERGPSGGFIVQDRGSSNGTRLNNQPMTDRLPLNENDELGVGSTTLVLKVVR